MKKIITRILQKLGFKGKTVLEKQDTSSKAQANTVEGNARQNSSVQEEAPVGSSYKRVGEGVVGRKGATPCHEYCPAEGEGTEWDWVETIVYTEEGPRLKLIPGLPKSPHTPVGLTVGRFSVYNVDERSNWEKIDEMIAMHKEEQKKGKRVK